MPEPSPGERTEHTVGLKVRGNDPERKEQT